MSGSQQLLLATIQQALPDPYFEYTTLLLPGNGTNGAQNNTFLDSSTNAFSITRNGNTTQGTFSPFSQTGWGAYFDGSGDYCTLSSNASMDFGAGNFTIECWVYTGVFSISAGASRTIIGNSGNSYTMQLYIETGSGKVVFGNTGSTNLQGTNTVADNQWHHIVVVRSGTGSNQTALFVDGNRQAVGTNSQNYSSGTIYLGAFDTGNGFWNGYISNLRIVKGTAVYDPTVTTLTVPTTPLTAVSNTALLTFQSNRFIDNSSNAYTITRNGDVSVQAFSPFNPTAAWSAATNGGSGYFDGSGDYLNTASNAAFALGSGSFTIEMWVYSGANGTSTRLGGNGAGGSFTTNRWIIATSTAANPNKFTLAAFNTSPVDLLVSTSTFNNSQWMHVAIARSGNAWAMWVNGAREAYVASNSAALDGGSSEVFNLGRSNLSGDADWAGYVSGFKMVKGTAVYDPASTTITIPTAPPANTTNTSLLLNYTNAGIYDATSKNDLETVGNAQISTTQSKFGGSSMYFDGTGDYLVCNAATNNLYAFGTGDFTLEMWVYFNSVASGSLFEFRPASTNGAYPLIYFSSSGVLTYYANSNPQINSSSVSTGQWYHIALCRYGTATKMYLNGIQTGSTYTDSSNYLCRANGPLIGVTSSLSSDFLNGYVDDFRITKGIARYTSNFTPPSTAFLTL